MDDALRAWAKDFLQASIDSNLEIAGKIYKNWDGTWSYSPATVGEQSASLPKTGDPWVATHGNPLQSYDIHSHGSYEGLSPLEIRSVNEFSPDDKKKSDSPTGTTQFMLTPGGEFKQYVPDANPLVRNIPGVGNGTVITLGNIKDSGALVPFF
jgi:hypothetical protein